MVVFRHGEAAQIADDKQGMRIDRVGMEQVVLHASHDTAEGWNVAAQYAVQIHTPQFVGHTERRVQNVDEQTVVAWVLTELFVYQPQVSAHQTNGGSAHAA